MNRQETFIYWQTLAIGLITSCQDEVVESMGSGFEHNGSVYEATAS